MKKIEFSDFIQENLKKQLEIESKKSLGDRSKYIGASDVGGCPYNVINTKLRKPDISFEKSIIFQRGHLAEEIVAKMLTGTNAQQQVELVGEMDNFPLIAHLDFLIKSKTRSIVIEAKTVSAPVDEPYESWILQVQFQMGLLMQDLDEDHKIEAYVIALDVNTGWHKVFKIEFDDDLFLMALNKAAHLISCLKDGEKPKAIIQNYCSTCPFLMECPKQGKFADEMPDDIRDDLVKIKAHKVNEKDIKKRTEKIKEYLINTGLEKVKLEESATTPQIMVSIKESTTNRFSAVDFKKVHPALAEEFSKESSSFRLTIS